MKQQTALVQMPLWEILLCGSTWIIVAARAWYAVFEASKGKWFYLYSHCCYWPSIKSNLGYDVLSFCLMSSLCNACIVAKSYFV